MHHWVTERTILLVRHGSHAYGTNIATSDEDFKGVCIEPKQYFFGFAHQFEQQEEMVHKGHPHDKVIYSLRKFMSLAVNCNPNIIEVLNVSDSDVLKTQLSGYGYDSLLRSIAPDLLSKKAYKSFSGYAMQQLHRIKTHKKWLLNPILREPNRTEFGLPSNDKLSDSEFGALHNLGEDHLSTSMIDLYRREKAYRNAVQEFENFKAWQKSRNPARAELEAKFGYDTKHAMHLIRLLKMALEILRDHKVVVKRPDAEELLAIRYGYYSYDELIELSEKLMLEAKDAVQKSTLPDSPDLIKLDSFIVQFTTDFLRKHH